MTQVKFYFHLSHAHRNYPGLDCPILFLQETAAPLLLIWQTLLQIVGQQRSTLRVLCGVKAGVQPVTEKGTIGQCQTNIIGRDFSLSVLPIMPCNFSLLKIRLHPFHYLFGPRDIWILLIEAKNATDQPLTNFIPAPFAIGEQFLFHKPATAQGPLQILSNKKCSGFRFFLFRVFFDLGQISVQSPVELQKILRFLSIDAGNPLCHDFTQMTIQDFRPSHDSRFQSQLHPEATVYFLRQLITLKKVNKHPQSRRMALIFGRTLLTALLDIG